MYSSEDAMVLVKGRRMVRGVRRIDWRAARRDLLFKVERQSCLYNRIPSCSFPCLMLSLFTPTLAVLGSCIPAVGGDVDDSVRYACPNMPEAGESLWNVYLDFLSSSQIFRETFVGVIARTLFWSVRIQLQPNLSTLSWYHLVLESSPSSTKCHLTGIACRGLSS